MRKSEKRCSQQSRFFSEKFYTRELLNHPFFKTREVFKKSCSQLENLYTGEHLKLLLDICSKLRSTFSRVLLNYPIFKTSEVFNKSCLHPENLYTREHLNLPLDICFYLWSTFSRELLNHRFYQPRVGTHENYLVIIFRELPNTRSSQLSHFSSPEEIISQNIQYKCSLPSNFSACKVNTVIKMQKP